MDSIRKGERQLIRKWMLCVLTAVLVTVTAIPANATRNAGGLTVMLDFADGEVHDGSVTLYYVGTAAGEHYRLTEAFGGGLVKHADSRSASLAQWLSESGESGGSPRLLDADGTAWFGGLEAGLYLLVQSQPIEGLDYVAPMLLPVPYEGQWELIALPQYSMLLTQLPPTGQTASPTLPAVTMLLSAAALCWLAVRKKHWFS